MKDKVSALMDGELDGREASDLLARLPGEVEAAETWRLYHLIRDAMHDDPGLGGSLADPVRRRIESEPTVIAPGAANLDRDASPRGSGRSTAAWSIAASVAAIGIVGWLGLAPRPAGESPAIAQVPRSTEPVAVAKGSPRASQRLPGEADDYLLAHQGYSPRSSLQGMAPYVRTVADQSMAGGAR